MYDCAVLARQSCIQEPPLWGRLGYSAASTVLMLVTLRALLTFDFHYILNGKLAKGWNETCCLVSRPTDTCVLPHIWGIFTHSKRWTIFPRVGGQMRYRKNDNCDLNGQFARLTIRFYHSLFSQPYPVIQGQPYFDSAFCLKSRSFTDSLFFHTSCRFATHLLKSYHLLPLNSLFHIYISR